MLGGEGYYRGTSILVSGTAGTGKTSLAAHFADATCRRGERCLYLAFEEAPQQLARNMRSIGVDLGPWLKKGLLRVEASRPTLYGIEMHLALIHKMVKDFDPQVVILDPISNFASAGTETDAETMLLRLIDFLKSRQITAMFVNLTGGGNALERTDMGVSSLIDTWILLRDIELAGERNRGLYVLKSRGMKHSNQIREFLITSEGIRLEDVYVGPEGVLTGSMRAAQEDREKAAALARGQELNRRQRELARRRAALEAQFAALRSEFQAVEDEEKILAEQDREIAQQIESSRSAAAMRRGADAPAATKGKRK
jgi:circadian clock protein KaiC